MLLPSTSVLAKLAEYAVLGAYERKCPMYFELLQLMFSFLIVFHHVNIFLCALILLFFAVLCCRFTLSDNFYWTYYHTHFPVFFLSVHSSLLNVFEHMYKAQLRVLTHGWRNQWPTLDCGGTDASAHL